MERSQSFTMQRLESGATPSRIRQQSFKRPTYSGEIGATSERTIRSSCSQRGTPAAGCLMAYVAGAVFHYKHVALLTTSASKATFLLGECPSRTRPSLRVCTDILCMPDDSLTRQTVQGIAAVDPPTTANRAKRLGSHSDFRRCYSSGYGFTKRVASFRTLLCGISSVSDPELNRPRAGLGPSRHGP